VVAITEDGSIADFDLRKAALRGQVAASGRDALLLLAADKISNVRALRVALDRSPEREATPASPEKVRH
jgi:hypothetical protein